MLFCVIGTPSAFSNYVALLARTMVGFAQSHVHFVAICTPEDLKAALQKRDDKPVLLFSDNLDRRIADVLIRAEAPTLILIEDHIDSVGYTMAARDVDIRAAIQLYSQSAACLEPFLHIPNLSIFWRPQADVTLNELIDEIALSFGFPLSPAIRDAVHGALVPYGTDADRETIDDQILRHVPHARVHRGFAKAFGNDDRTLIKDALQPYSALLAGKPRPFRWPTRLFRDSFRPDLSIEAPLDLTGPARSLMFGPLLHLPPGRWTVTVMVKVSDNLSGNVLMSDIVADNAVFMSAEGELPAAGIFTYPLDFEVDDPRLPVAVRLAIQFGAIEGVLQLIGAEAVRRSDPNVGGAEST